MARPTVAEADLLTQAECDLLALIAEGLTDGEAADRLVLKKATVNSYMTQILLKLHARNRAQAVAVAVVRGQLELVPVEVTS